MLIMLTLYGIAIWLIFYKLHWLEMTKRAACMVVFIGVVFLLLVYVGLGRRTPASADAFSQGYVVQVGARVEGRVEEVFVGNDQFVRKGDPLFSLEKLPYEIARDQALAALHRAQEDQAHQYATLDSARKSVAKIEADLKLARVELERARALRKERVASQQELDSATAQEEALAEQLDQALAEVRKAEVTLYPVDVLEAVEARKRAALAAGIEDQALRTRTEEEVKRATYYLEQARAVAPTLGLDRPTVHEARARLAKAEYDLSETTVYAPLDGWISNLQLAPGKNILLARWEVMSLVVAEPWWVNGSFVERSLEKMRPGDRCEVALKAYPGRIFACEVTSVNRGVAQGQGQPSGDLPGVTPSQSAAQLFPVWVRVLDERLSQAGALRVGGKASVTVYTGRGANLGLNVLAKVLIRLRSVMDFFM